MLAVESSPAKASFSQLVKLVAVLSVMPLNKEFGVLAAT
jgi:hypothetical protein